MKKKIFKILAPLSTIMCTGLLAASCNTNTKVEKSNWNDPKFVDIIKKNNLNNLSYDDEAKNAKFIAPFNDNIKSNVMYQLTVYSFADGNGDYIGDFIGLKNNLDYFVDLGIDTLYLSPIHPASSYHGYDVIDYTDIAPELGGMEAFDQFLQEAHKKGIKVVMDMIFNHTSYEHPWFQKALQGVEPYVNYYRFFSDSNLNNLSAYGKDDKHLRDLFYNVDKNIQPTNKTYVAEFWGGMPDLNLDSPELNKEIENIHKFWTKKGVDGFRYDAFYHFYGSRNKYEPTKDASETAKLFANWRNASKSVINPQEKRSSDDVLMFGEWWNNTLDASVYFNYKNQKALDTVIDGQYFKNNNVGYISYNVERNIISELSKDNQNRLWLPFLDNHDVERFINNLKGRYRDEPEHLLMHYKQMLLILLSKPGKPILYDGNELGMHGGPKSKGDHKVREAFNWSDKNKIVDFYERRSGPDSSHIVLGDSQDTKTIEEQRKDKNSLFNFTKKLIQIRKDNPFLSEMDPETIVEPLSVVTPKSAMTDGQIYVRKNKEGKTLVFATYLIGNDFDFTLKKNYKNVKILDEFNTQKIGNKNFKILDEKIPFSYIILELS
ncbi:alpha-amylase family glycosyl hydrolase [Mycoplasmopsis ciconiae]|uniref:Alpha-amylase n=1 Tax=Mycoplasmopsis ciconiae TaxID=561067 RepID=A0ABU7MM74_9BACT|nr:alpha-amylase family glycosyl hydrolase [Mycoplasmopsis ciconiae]